MVFTLPDSTSRSISLSPHSRILSVFSQVDIRPLIIALQVSVLTQTRFSPCISTGPEQVGHCVGIAVVNRGFNTFSTLGIISPLLNTNTSAPTPRPNSLIYAMLYTLAFSILLPCKFVLSNQQTGVIRPLCPVAQTIDFTWVDAN